VLLLLGRKTSFCKQKACAPRKQKILFVLVSGRFSVGQSGAKVFWFFFQKRTSRLYLLWR
jgi:hypothetical protein